MVIDIHPLLAASFVAAATLVTLCYLYLRHPTRYTSANVASYRQGLEDGYADALAENPSGAEDAPATSILGFVP